MSYNYPLWTRFSFLAPIVACVGVVVFCGALCYTCCRKKSRRTHQNVTTVVYAHPPPPHPPVSVCQPPHPYQPVPVDVHGGLPTAPPPSYLEAVALSPPHPGLPVAPHPVQPALHPDVPQQLPYNPAFCPGAGAQSLHFNSY